MKNVEKILNILAEQQGITMLGQFRKYPAWQILISTILSARANDNATIPVSKELFKRYPTLEKLSRADAKRVKKIIKRTVYYNQKTKYILNTAKILLKEYKGKVPQDMDELMKFPGVGHKVAACVLVYAFDKPSIPVDTHVAVISQRLGWTKQTDPKKIMFDLMKKIHQKHWNIINELFVIHGQTICFKRNPHCYECPISKYCLYKHKNILRPSL